MNCVTLEQGFTAGEMRTCQGTGAVVVTGTLPRGPQPSYLAQMSGLRVFQLRELRRAP